MKRHYSVRRCVANYPSWKVVIAGGWGGYKDIDGELYGTFDAAIDVADRLNESANKRYN